MSAFTHDKIATLGDRLASASAEHVTEDSLQVISGFAYAFQLKYHTYFISVTPSADTAFTRMSEQSAQLAKALKETLTDSSLPFIESIAKSKYLLDELFFSCTKKGFLNYRYQKKALLNSSKIQEALGVSRATISRYVKIGMETTEGTGHERYPQHNVYYWQNGVWAAKIQALNERYRLRNRTTEEAIRDLQKEIGHFESAYKGEFHEIFGDVADPYALNEPEDYFNWRDAVEELGELNE